METETYTVLPLSCTKLLDQFCDKMLFCANHMSGWFWSNFEMCQYCHVLCLNASELILLELTLIKKKNKNKRNTLFPLPSTQSLMVFFKSWWPDRNQTYIIVRLGICFQEKCQILLQTALVFFKTVTWQVKECKAWQQYRSQHCLAQQWHPRYC